MLSSFTGRSTSLQCMEGGYFRNIPFKRFMKLNKYGCGLFLWRVWSVSVHPLQSIPNDNAYHLNLPPSNSLAQIVIDNFDLDIASPNGKAQTHSPGNDRYQERVWSFRREQSNNDIPEFITRNVTNPFIIKQIFNGTKGHKIPKWSCFHLVLKNRI